MTIKRVKVDELRAGMYVHDLNCGWLEHGFFRQQFLLKHGQIQKIKEQGLREVYIDTSRGEDVPGAPGQEAVQRGLKRRLEATAGGPALSPAKVPRKEEAATARRILGEAHGVVEELLQGVRLGQQIDPSKAKPLVEEIHASVLRNPGALISLGRIKAADTYTFQHSVSLCALMISFAQAMGVDKATVQEAGLGGLLHDIGKMKVPLDLLNKPGRLTEDEFAVMKRHVPLGCDLLAQVPGISKLVIQIAGEHHEKLAGGGYPLGLSGPRISDIGRMAAIADIYDALTSDRVYHKGVEPSEVLKSLLEWSGPHLDGDLVHQFIRTLGIYPVGSLVHLSSGRLAVVVEQGENLLRPTVRVVFDAGRKIRLQPRDLHLARAASEQILDYQDPVVWGLDPASFL